MRYPIREASTTSEWAGAMDVLRAVYVGEGHSAPERAGALYNRQVLEPEGTLLVASAPNGDVVGVALFLHEQSSMRQVAMQGEREFRLLAVRSDARGTGVGADLVRACMSRAQGAEALVLWTRPVMRSAQRLYERLGFTRQPERDTDDARGFKRLVYRAPMEGTTLSDV